MNSPRQQLTPPYILRLLLRPVAKFCLRNQLGLRDLLEAAKAALIDEAVADMEGQGAKVNLSRLSVVTGVHRKDTARIYREQDVHESATRFTSRLIGQWRKDPRFTTRSNRPRVLTCSGDDSEFAKLVGVVSTDLHPGTVMFDLERIGAVERTKNGVRLLAKAYVPRGDPAEGWYMLARDAVDLVEAVSENIESREEVLPNYHASAVFDNIAAEEVPKIRLWLFRQCSRFHQRVAQYLAKHDLDLAEDVKDSSGGQRVSMGIYTKT